MRVLLGLGYYEGGGFTTVINMLAGYLQKQGVEVTVASRVVRLKPPEYMKLLKLTPSEFFREALKHDLVHIHLSYPYLKAIIKGNYRHVVVTHHGYAPWRIVPGFKNKLTSLYLRLAYNTLLPKVLYIVAVSNYVKEQLNTLYGLESKVIYNGVNTKIFKPMKMKGSSYPVVFNATAWNRLKGADLLLEHIGILKKYYPEAKLIARGLPLSSFWVKKLVRKVGLRPENDLEVPPYIPYENLSFYYNLADFYLLTSRWESFCLPILESFACGTPVIAYDMNDSRREHIGISRAGLLYKDEEALMHAVENVLKNRHTYSQRAVEYAKRFDWDIIAQEYINVYKAAL